MESVEYEKVPLLTVWTESNTIKFRTTPDIDQYALLGFLKTYIKFLETEVMNNMAKDNSFFGDKNE